MARIESELPEDKTSIRAVHLAAFHAPMEANLVDRLRANGQAVISLVAREGEALVGHVLFSPVTIRCTDAETNILPRSGLGLAPLAVVPDYQRQGIGAALVEAGLVRCRELGVDYVVVLGEPMYYSRFGFQPASRYGLTSQYDAGDAFQVLVLRTETPPSPGLVLYGEEFAGLE